MKKAMTHRGHTESGAIMLEGMIVVIVTLFVLLWILGLGFLYYQRYVTTVVTNDAAVKIAATYNNPTSDIVMGYITTEELRSRSLYRNMKSKQGNLEDANQKRAESYVRTALNRVNFSGVVQDVHVDLTLVQDSYLRKHVQLTTECTYKTPFGAGLEMFGMQGTRTYRFSASADCTDYYDYIALVDFQKAAEEGSYTSGMGFVSSIVKLLNKLAGYYNHNYF